MSEARSAEDRFVLGMKALIKVADGALMIAQIHGMAPRNGPDLVTPIVEAFADVRCDCRARLLKRVLKQETK
jgi:hypothetical protein